MSDRTIKVEVNLPGQFIGLTRERGFGDNPAFYANQVDAVLDGMKQSLRSMIEAEHGKQWTADKEN